MNVDFNYTNVQVSIDADYACTIYTSCKGTSFIAAAGVSSSISFLTFLGYNGAMYSLSYINFTSTEGVTPGQLDSEAVQCQDPVPPMESSMVMTTSPIVPALSARRLALLLS